MLISKEDAYNSILVCDVETICMGFDFEQLQHLYWEYVGMKAPRGWDSVKLATKIKQVVSSVDSALEAVKSMGITDAYSLEKFLAESTVKELIQNYSKVQLKNLYLVTFGSNPLSQSTGLDLAEALVAYIKNVKRTKALLASSDKKCSQ